MAFWMQSRDSGCRESIVSDKWIIDELESSDVGSYMGLPRGLLPEVFFEDELPVWEELHPRGGCRGLEVVHSSERHHAVEDTPFTRHTAHSRALSIYHLPDGVPQARLFCRRNLRQAAQTWSCTENVYMPLHQRWPAKGNAKSISLALPRPARALPWQLWGPR